MFVFCFFLHIYICPHTSVHFTVKQDHFDISVLWTTLFKCIYRCWWTPTLTIFKANDALEESLLNTTFVISYSGDSCSNAVFPLLLNTTCYCLVFHLEKLRIVPGTYGAFKLYWEVGVSVFTVRNFHWNAPWGWTSYLGNSEIPQYTWDPLW